MASPDPVLTSRSNPRILAVAALRNRRERERHGLTVVDGAREVRRALEGGAAIVEAFVCEPMLKGEDARAALEALRGAPVSMTSVSAPVMEKLAFGERAEGILVTVRIPDIRLERLTLPEEPLVVILEGVEKPGNIGAALRSADGAGADALVAASPRTDLFNPNAIRASAGTIFSVPLASAGSGEVLDWAGARGLRVVATRVDASRPYWASDLTGAVAIVLGAETEGLSDTWRGDGVEEVRIPMRGSADSLNVSVSAAILLYEARRQRGGHEGEPD